MFDWVIYSPPKIFIFQSETKVEQTKRSVSYFKLNSRFNLTMINFVIHDKLK